MCLAVSVGLSRRDDIGSLRRGQGIAQFFDAEFGHRKDGFRVGAGLFNGLKVVFDAGDDVGQGIQRDGIRHLLPPQHVVTHIFDGRVQQLGGPLEVQYRQGALDLRQLGRHVFDGCKRTAVHGEGIEAFLDIGEQLAGFVDHQIDDLRLFAGRHQHRRLLFVAKTEVRCIRRFVAAGCGIGVIQRGLDIEQRTGHLHQQTVVRDLIGLDKGVDVPGLLLNDLAQISQAQHGQGIGNATQAVAQRHQRGDVMLAVANEDIQLILDRQQVLLDHRRDAVHEIGARSLEVVHCLFQRATVGQ